MLSLGKAFTLLEPGPVVLVTTRNCVRLTRLATPHFAFTAAVSSLIVNI